MATTAPPYINQNLEGWRVFHYVGLLAVKGKFIWGALTSQTLAPVVVAFSMAAAFAMAGVHSYYQQKATEKDAQQDSRMDYMEKAYGQEFDAISRDRLERRELSDKRYEQMDNRMTSVEHSIIWLWGGGSVSLTVFGIAVSLGFIRKINTSDKQQQRSAFTTLGNLHRDRRDFRDEREQEDYYAAWFNALEADRQRRIIEKIERGGGVNR